jgi:hypothetical protein
MTPRRLGQAIQRILQSKVCETPRWLESKYLPFAAYLITATLFLLASPVGIWQAVRLLKSSRALLKSLPATAPTTQDSVTLNQLYYFPLWFLDISVLFGLVGIFFLRATMKEWQKLRMVRGFEVMERKSS